MCFNRNYWYCAGVITDTAKFVETFCMKKRIGIFLILFKKIIKKQEIAFGPYLALGSYAVLFLPSPNTVVSYLMMIEENFLAKYIFTNLQNLG